MNAIPFTPRDAIPIVGQAVTLKGGFATVLVQCGCGAKEPVLLVGPSPQACAACGRRMAVASSTFNALGQVTAEIGFVAPEPREGS